MDDYNLSEDCFAHMHVAFGYELETNKMERLAPILLEKWPIRESETTILPIPSLVEMAVEYLLMHPKALAARSGELSHPGLEPFMEVLMTADYRKMGDHWRMPSSEIPVIDAPEKVEKVEEEQGELQDIDDDGEEEMDYNQQYKDRPAYYERLSTTVQNYLKPFMSHPASHISANDIKLLIANNISYGEDGGPRRFLLILSRSHFETYTGSSYDYGSGWQTKNELHRIKTRIEPLEMWALTKALHILGLPHATATPNWLFMLLQSGQD